MSNIDFKRALIDYQNIECEISSGQFKQTFFKSNGYYIETYPENINKDILHCFNPELSTDYKQSDFTSDFEEAIRKDDLEKIQKMNNQYIFYSAPIIKSNGYKGLENLLNHIEKKIEEQIGSAFEIINIRSWETKNTSNYGPTKMHRDGGSFLIRKIMIYPYGLNDNYGGLEFISLKKEKLSFSIHKPSWVLINSSQLLHRGVPPKKDNFHRPAIEITIRNSLKNSISLKFSGHNARMPKTDISKLPKCIPFEASTNEVLKKEKIINKRKLKLVLTLLLSGKIFNVVLEKLKFKIIRRIQNSKKEFIIPELYLNLGGGRITHPEFRNLDVVKSETNPYPFIFSKESIFPISSTTVPIVYTSHFIEHINDETVKNILSESRRVLTDDGILIIKIPDFDMYLDALKKGDSSKFNLQNVEWSWKNKNVPITWKNIALMWFCGFWNKEYGSHFLQKIDKNDVLAYHGPPVSALSHIEKILTMNSPHKISKFLKDMVLSEEVDYTFNHQNSWSRLELLSLLKDNNFQEISFNKKDIVKEYNFLPKIMELYETSTYCLAKKKINF